MPRYKPGHYVHCTAVLGTYEEVARYFKEEGLIPDAFFTAEREGDGRIERIVGYPSSDDELTRYDVIIHCTPYFADQEKEPYASRTCNA